MTRKRALIADDSEMNAVLLSEMIDSYDFDCDIAFDGKEALKYARKNSYDVIFLDHLMPVMDGIEALKAMKAEKLQKGVPVIMVTANDSEDDKEVYLRAGFSDYMKKPFSVKGIGEIIGKHGILEEDPGEKDEWEALSEKFNYLNPCEMKEYYLGDTTFYIQVLHEYVKSDILVRLETLEVEGKNDDLRSSIRNIRDEARLIGAMDLAKKAAYTEQLLIDGKDEDFLEGCEKLLGKRKRLIKRLAAELS